MNSSGLADFTTASSTVVTFNSSDDNGTVMVEPDATVSAAMRLMSIGQTAAHALLARSLDRVPAVVDDIARRDARIESFTPALDIAAMTQQYVHSRLFRS